MRWQKSRACDNEGTTLVEPPLNFPSTECYVDWPGVPTCFEMKMRFSLVFPVVFAWGFSNFRITEVLQWPYVQVFFGEFSLGLQAKLLEDQRRSLKHFENVQSGLSIWAEEHLT